MNGEYGKKFGFPFIVCVRRHTRDSILRQFERRLALSPEGEFAAALAEIGYITRLRLVDKVDGPGPAADHGTAIDPCARHLSRSPCPRRRGDAARKSAPARAGHSRRDVTNKDGRTDRAADRRRTAAHRSV